MRAVLQPWIWIYAFVALGAMGGCGKAPAGFATNTHGQVGAPGTPGCTAGTTTSNLRILVMVDNSGSTSSTDPSQFYRVQTLRTFLSSYSGHVNLRYSFGYFDDDAYLFDMNLGRFSKGSSSVPFGTGAGESSALDTYHNSSPPLGGTGYAAAFDALSSAIARDEASGTVADYAVVFMSDGQPTDINGDVATAIANLVTNLKNTAASNGHSHVAVSTVYFGSAADTTSIQNLRSMATQGGGQFVDTNHLSSGGLSIDDVVTIPGC
jgi:hypothetical protein